jgi:hypothetical protein
MLRGKAITISFCHIIVGALILLCGCSKHEQLMSSQSLSPAQTAAVSQQAKPSQPQKPSASLDLPAPQLAEVQEAIKRTYKTAVILDASRNQNFTVGDFNGDGSQDIAVAVKPAKGMLADINSEYANWMLEDPQQVKLSGSNKAVRHLPSRSKPVQVEAGDSLLAIIHGYGPYGWRDLSARQTYLLKNAAGSNIAMQTKKDLLSATKDNDDFPPLRGDAIKETLGQEAGFILWSGAEYAWYYDPTMNKRQGK